MNDALNLVTSPSVLAGEGLGNEIAFYVFAFDPNHAPYVQRQLKDFLERRVSVQGGPRVGHVDLFQLVTDYLRGRGFLEKAVEHQRTHGDAAVLNVLSAPLKAERMASEFVDRCSPTDHDIVLVSGIGACWPMLRAHALLTNLHALMGTTPLVLFYPGAYDGQSFSLFGRLPPENYYRAFSLC